MPPDVAPTPPPPGPAKPAGEGFALRWPAVAATLLSLAGYGVCSYYERSSPLMVGLGLAAAFGGFVGVSLAMVLSSDREDGGPGA